jgi:hypothetical protein
MSNPFDFFDFSEEDVAEVVQERKSNPYRRDGAICLCGHARSKHVEGPLGFTCAPAKQFCPCKSLRVVARTSDTRCFLFKTTGPGKYHALSMGLSKAQKVGADVEWLGEGVCDRCQMEVPVQPVAVSQRGVTMNEATGFDALLCVDCRMEV